MKQADTLKEHAAMMQSICAENSMTEIWKVMHSNLGNLLSRLLEKALRLRPQSAHEVLKALQKVTRESLSTALRSQAVTYHQRRYFVLRIS